MVDPAASPALPFLAEADQLNQVRLLEALLFAAAEPLTPAMIHERLGQGADVAALIESLQAHYQHRGIQLVAVAGGWAFRTAPDLAAVLRLERPVPRKLSRAALEVLAIIAYHQPVTRAEIEAIRGVVTSRGTLDTLLEVGWIRPGKRKQTPGRPVTWLTTEAFLNQFGLEGLGALPGIDELKAAGLLETNPAILPLPFTPEEQGPDEGDVEDDD